MDAKLGLYWTFQLLMSGQILLFFWFAQQNICYPGVYSSTFQRFSSRKPVRSQRVPTPCCQVDKLSGWWMLPKEQPVRSGVEYVGAWPTPQE
jgi:hypothetical protein